MSIFDVNTFDESEFHALCDKFNPAAYIKEVVINYASNSFFNFMKNNIQKDRRGEVVFCVIRPNGKIISITCKEYPKNIYRIPTGGIGHNEDISDAVFREVKEELGIDIEVMSFAGVLKIKFQHKNEFARFYSYMFILKETGGNLLKDASDDEISEIFEASLDELQNIVTNLKNLNGRWKDWGTFRYQTSNEILNILKNNKNFLKENIDNN